MSGFGRRAFAGVALTFTLAVAGCDSSSSRSPVADGSPVIAEVNGVPITRKDLRTVMMLRGGEAQPPQKALGKALVEELIERRLILQRSRETGGYVEEARVNALIRLIAGQYGSEEELEKILLEDNIDRKRWHGAIRETLEIDQTVEREVYSKLILPEGSIRKYYEQNRGRFRVGRRWRVRQIVVDSEEEARRLREQIVGGVSFSLLARKSSAGPERNRGGDMGFFSAEQLPESVESVIKALKEGEVSRVVHTSSGYHLFQVTERRSAGIQPIGAVRAKIQAQLLAEIGREKLKAWLSGLREKATIRYYWRNLNDNAAG